MDASMLSTPAALFGGAAAFGVITSCWGNIRNAFNRLMGFMIIRAELDTDLVSCVNAWAWLKLKKTPLGFGSFGAGTFFVQPRERIEQVAYENIGSKSMLFWRGWRPIMLGFSFSKDKPNHGTVTFIRGMFSIEKLLVEAVDVYNDATRGGDETVSRFKVTKCQGSGSMKSRMGGGGGTPDDDGIGGGGRRSHRDNESAAPSVRYLRWDRRELGLKSEGKAALDRMALSPQCEEAAVEAARWSTSEKWYKERQIPWRRGWLLHGSPGTGKTSYVRSLAQDLNMPVYAFDLGTMNNSEFNGFWSQVRQNVPAIVLIEDIDGVFDKRENVLGDQGGGLSFDCLLNGIAGVDNSDGIFVVITTNKLECIDEALGLPTGDGMSTRPGRLDRVLQLSAPTPEGRLKIATRILSGEPQEIIDGLVSQGHGMTGAQFQELCSRLALARYWEQKLKDSQCKSPTTSFETSPLDASGPPGVQKS